MNSYLAFSLIIFMFGIIPLVLMFVLKNNKHIKIIFSILFAIYCVILCLGVLTNIRIGKTIILATYPAEFNKFFNWKPFTTNIFDIFINICMLMPFGFLLAALFNKFRFIKVSAMGLIVAIIIEVLQLILPIMRTAQLSDIVLNTFSCAIGSVGFILFNMLKNKLRNNRRT